MAAIGNLTRSDRFTLFSDYSFINFCYYLFVVKSASQNSDLVNHCQCHALLSALNTAGVGDTEVISSAAK